MKSIIALLLLSATVPRFAVAKTEVECQGTYVHRSGLFAFPEKVGDFTRQAITRYDLEGNDVGVVYRCAASNSMVISVYAYPVPVRKDGKPAAFREMVVAEQVVIMERTARTKAIQWPKGIPLWSDEGVTGALVAFDLGGTGQYVSLLQLYDYGPWLLKFRTSYEAEKAVVSEREIDAFHRAFRWPKRDAERTDAANGAPRRD